MSGQLTIFGEVTVGGFVPGISGIHAAMLAELRAKHAGYLKSQAGLKIKPPSLTANIEAVGALLVAMKALIGVQLPGIDFKLALLGRLIADLDAKIQALLGLPFATGGLIAAAYVGTTQELGPTVTGAFGGGLPGGGSGSDTCYALIAATRFAETWSALGKVCVSV